MIFSQRKIKYGFLETATSGGTLTLDVDSKEIQIFTGTMSHTVVLPNATTLVNGIAFKIINLSTQSVTVNRNGGTLLNTLESGNAIVAILTSNSTAPGVWSLKEGTQGTGSGAGSEVVPAEIIVNTPISAGDSGKVLKVNTTGGSVTLTLPAPADGFIVTVKDTGNFASVNNIRIDRNGSELIDGVVADAILNEDGGSLTLISDGTDWSRCDQGSVSNVHLSGRGLFGGGDTGAVSDTIDYVAIATLGNAVDFGNLFLARRTLGACSSRVLGIFAGGITGAVNDTIDYVEFSTLGNAADFGNLTVARNGLSGCSNNTRGLFGGGFNAVVRNEIDYIIIATTGNAVDFGDLTVARQDTAALSSSVRGVFAGGTTGTVQNTIDYITIATTGNAVDFGDLTTVRYTAAGCSNSVIGLFGGGIQTPVTPVNNIDYITIATLGNAADFGDLTVSRFYAAACSSESRGLFAGGNTGAISNVIDYVEFDTLANAVDFGDLSVTRDQVAGCSSSHGGLYV